MVRRLVCFLIVTSAAVVPTYAAASDDRYSSRQWALRRVRAEAAWPAGQGAGATIAIVDTGVDPRHEDLRGNVVAGYDFVDRDADPRDEHGHGTHVAGIAAARADNDIGIAGVAPRARIMPIRVLNENGRGFDSDIDEGVRWAVDHGADVVNLSLGGDNIVIENLAGGTLPQTLDYAWEHGVVPVLSSGNEGFFRTELADARAFIVTATTPDDTRAYYATDVGFARWGIAAPGGTDAGGKDTMVFSTLWSTKGARYGWAYGTSMAAPHVAGAAAILRGAGFSAQQTVDRLLSSAKDLGASGDDFTYGHGRVDVAAAVKGLPMKKAASSANTPSDDTPSPDDEAAGAPVLRPAQTPSASSATDRPSPTKAVSTDPPTSSPDRRVAAAEEEGDRGSMLPNLIIGGLVVAALGALLVAGRLRQTKG